MLDLSALARFFPEEREQWDVERLAHVLPLPLRLRVREAFGGLMAAADHTTHLHPSRLGLSLRPYAPGDRLQTLAMAPWIRQGQLLTRTDWAPGRENVGLILHLPGTMAWRSHDTLPYKGQVLLASAALVALAHETLGHHIETHVVWEDPLDVWLLSAHSRMKSWHHTALFSDALWDDTQVHAVGARLQQALHRMKIPRLTGFVIRDPLETPSPEHNPLAHAGDALADPKWGRGIRHGGALYLENLSTQWKDIQKAFQNQGAMCHMIHGRMAMSQMLSLVERSLTLFGAPNSRTTRHNGG